MVFSLAWVSLVVFLQSAVARQTCWCLLLLLFPGWLMTWVGHKDCPQLDLAAGRGGTGSAEL